MPAKPTIAVNVAVLGLRPTGLGVHAFHVIHALAGLVERLIARTSRPDLISLALLARPVLAVRRAPGVALRALARLRG